MYARIAAFVIWSLVAATLVFWALRFGVSAPKAPAHAVAIGKAAPPRGDLARLFGAEPIVVAAAESVPEASSRFRLVGVMAPRASRAEGAGYGLALIAVDGKPPRAFTVGSSLDTDLVLQSVGLRSASIGAPQGARSVLLELPSLPEPATGVLAAPGTPGSTGAPMGAMPSGRMPNTLQQIVPSPVQPVPPPALQSVPMPVPPANAGSPNLPMRDGLATQ